MATPGSSVEPTSREPKEEADEPLSSIGPPIQKKENKTKLSLGLRVNPKKEIQKMATPGSSVEHIPRAPPEDAEKALSSIGLPI